jgi:hypothetical protein
MYLIQIDASIKLPTELTQEDKELLAIPIDDKKFYVSKRLPNVKFHVKLD